jgi:hypothetical protein
MPIFIGRGAPGYRPSWTSLAASLVFAARFINEAKANVTASSMPRSWIQNREHPCFATMSNCWWLQV